MTSRLTRDEFTIDETYIISFLDKSEEGIIAERNLINRYGVHWRLHQIVEDQNKIKYLFRPSDLVEGVNKNFVFVTQTPEQSFV